MTRPAKTGAVGPTIETQAQSHTVVPEEHPDYVPGQMDDGDWSSEHGPDGLTPNPDDPFPGPLPKPWPLPTPIPTPIPFPFPKFCAAVSGRYNYRPRVVSLPTPPPGPIFPGRPVPQPQHPGPRLPFNMLNITVRVDVDRFAPQNRISIELSRLFPRQTAHAIAEVTSDRCVGTNNRIVTANIVYRDGDSGAIPGTTVTFRARAVRGFRYNKFSIELSGGGITPRTYELSFQSDKFDDVEFEVDRVANAGTIVTAYDTSTHPNRPADLPAETLSLATVYERAGFGVTMSPNTTVIPTSGANANGTWSDAEMHNAMVTYWSRFADKPQWAMWVLYAAQHDQGASLGGVMFDDIGDNHRQGTAIFTDSFIQDAPAGDPNAPAWRNRMQFWTAVHEMGHGFNLAHSWQKALGTPNAPGDPWIPLANEPEARSFMNYPYNVAGGENAFFSDFRFRFSDDELVFMRHAPRRFVQMGNSDWFVNHGFEAPNALRQTGNWELAIRPNRDVNAYQFLEPVTMELKLTNTSPDVVMQDPDLLEDGHHVTVFIQREGGSTRQWRPMVTHCHQGHAEKLEPGESIYGAHMVSNATSGWMIDEPGFYKLQAAVDMGGEIIVSNVLRLYVAPPQSSEEAMLAPDYFTEDVARVLNFGGAPILNKAEDTLRHMVDVCADHPATSHARVALSSPSLRDFKVLETGSDRSKLGISTLGKKTSQAAKTQIDALLKKPEAAADTIGHIRYFGQLRKLAEALEDAGAQDEAVNVMERSIAVMKARGILGKVIDNAERRLRRRM